MTAVPRSVDLVIVGSGPAGSTFLRLVRESLPNATVVMLERGPALTSPVGVNVRNLPDNERAAAKGAAEGTVWTRIDEFRSAHGEPLILPRPGTQLVTLTEADGDPQSGMPGALFASGVGGMGSFWTCAVPRPRGTERVPFIGQREMDDSLDVAERLLEKTIEGYPETVEGDLVLNRLSTEFDHGQPGAAGIQRMPLACRRDTGERTPRWTGVDVILDSPSLAVDGSDGLWILSECAGVEVLMDGGTAKGVRARYAGTESSFDIAARVVVVAADTLRTPQLLWASGIRPTALGRYVNDQPQVIAAVFLDRSDATSEAAGVTDRAASGRSLPFDSGEAHPFHGTPNGGQDSLAGVSWVPFDSDNNRPFHGQVMQMDASPIAIGDAAVNDERPIVGIGFFATKELQPSDRVWFDDHDLDEFGLPAIRIDYELTPADKDTIERMVQLTARTARALGEYVPGGQPIVLPAGSSIHYQGSVRMGERDDGTSVCDSFSVVWGTTNLFVGGNGVIPTATACNPTLTNVALAARASTRVIELLS